MTRHRPLLALLAVVVLAGCLATGPSASDAPGVEAGDGVGATGDEASPTPSDGPQGGQERVIGAGDPISVDATVDREGIEYYPENDTIRYVARYRHTNHDAVVNGSEPPEREPVYAFTSFEDWADTEAASVGARAVVNATRNRTSLSDPGLGGGISSAGTDLNVTVSRSTVLDRQGQVTSDSAIEFDELRRIAPASVNVTITIDDRSASRSYTVVATNRTLQLE